MPILLDFESRSRADLRRVGGRLYWEDPSTEALCCVLYDTDTGDVGLWLAGDPCPVSPGDVLAAHNAMGFDRFAAAAVWDVPIDGPWVDTAELARRAGLPGALDALGTRWLDIPKDKVASRFTRNLSSVRRPAGDIDADTWRGLTPTEKKQRGAQPTIDGAAMDRVVAYCVSDVEILAHGWDQLEPWLEVDEDTSAAERAVNDRGIGFDVKLARRLLECDAENRDKMLRKVGRKLAMSPGKVREIASSPVQFTEYTGAENAQKQTVAELVTQGGRAGAMAEARQALASIARGKLEAGLAHVSADGRLRDSHRYYGAHTGRWSQRGMQLHNMPRPADRFDGVDVDEFTEAFLAGDNSADREEIDLMLRACLVAKPGYTFVVCDFSGVEARALAWCAGDSGALEVFASDRDPYKTAAATIFGVPYDTIGKDEKRQAGKIAELACGYGGGANALLNMAAGMGIDLEASGVDAATVVKGWRRLHAPVVRFWREIENAFMSAVRGVPADVACFSFVPADDGSAVAAILPSGRPIVYEEAELTRGPYGPSPVYMNTKGFREHTYGGKLTENLIQALCRDLLAEALVRVERKGMHPVLHVHDEIVCEVPIRGASKSYDTLRGEMLKLSDWAQGFPIGASGHIARRYKK